MSSSENVESRLRRALTLAGMLRTESVTLDAPTARELVALIEDVKSLAKRSPELLTDHPRLRALIEE